MGNSWKPLRAWQVSVHYNTIALEFIQSVVSTFFVAPVDAHYKQCVSTVIGHPGVHSISSKISASSLMFFSCPVGLSWGDLWESLICMLHMHAQRQMFPRANHPSMNRAQIKSKDMLLVNSEDKKQYEWDCHLVQEVWVRQHKKNYDHISDRWPVAQLSHGQCCGLVREPQLLTHFKPVCKTASKSNQCRIFIGQVL